MSENDQGWGSVECIECELGRHDEGDCPNRKGGSDNGG